MHVLKKALKNAVADWVEVYLLVKARVLVKG
jgi:hypothetical protein